MKKTNRIPAALAAIILIVSAGCIEMDIPPAGSYSEVLLVSEEGAQDALARELEPELSRQLDFYVGTETQFRVKHVRAADLYEVPATKNVLICGVADPLTDVGRQITAQLGNTSVERIRQGEANIFKRENLPAAGQLTLIVTARSSQELGDVIETRSDDIVEALEASCRNRLRRYMLTRKNDALTKRLLETYGFVIEVPTYYKIESEELNPPGIELLRDTPARVLGIFWVDWKNEPTIADSTALFEARAKYVWERYNGDEMDSTRVAFKYTTLGKYPAVEMSGYWSSSTSIAGGFYRTFFVFEERERLLWAIDTLVFAPGMPKHAYFRELKALAETFRYD
jgi:hypothetical protein